MTKLPDGSYLGLINKKYPVLKSVVTDKAEAFLSPDRVDKMRGFTPFVTPLSDDVIKMMEEDALVSKEILEK
jgi:hypothetical protein